MLYNLENNKNLERTMKKILIILGFGLMVLVVILNTGCMSKSGYDIMGAWVITMNISDGLLTNTYIFSGNKNEGTVTIENIPSNGNYIVAGDTVQFSVSYGVAAPLYSENFTGQFENEDSMRGNFTITLDGVITDTGTWQGAR
jgi:hypothetical protein